MFKADDCPDSWSLLNDGELKTASHSSKGNVVLPFKMFPLCLQALEVFQFLWLFCVELWFANWSKTVEPMDHNVEQWAATLSVNNANHWACEIASWRQIICSEQLHLLHVLHIASIEFHPNNQKMHVKWFDCGTTVAPRIQLKHALSLA